MPSQNVEYPPREKVMFCTEVETEKQKKIGPAGSHASWEIA